MPLSRPCKFGRPLFLFCLQCIIRQIRYISSLLNQSCSSQLIPQTLLPDSLAVFYDSYTLLRATWKTSFRFRANRRLVPIDVEFVLCVWSISVCTRDVTAASGISENTIATMCPPFSHPYPKSFIRHVAADTAPCLPPGQSGPEACRDLSQRPRRADANPRLSNDQCHGHG